jgi:hypothetical protein
MSYNPVCPPSLRRHKRSIKLLNVDGQTIGYTLSRWAESIGDRLEFKSVTARFPTAISRSNLRALAARTNSNPALLRELFVAS